MADARLEVLMTLEDKASRALESVGGKVKSLGDRLRGLLPFQDQSNRRFKDMEANSSTLGDKVRGLAAAVGAAIAVFAGWRVIDAAVDSTQQLGREVSRLSRETGLTAEESSKLLFVFRQTGLDADDASRSLGIFAKNLKGVSDEETGVIKGGKAFTQILKDIGVNVLDVRGQILPMNDVLLQLADRFQAMPNGIEKTGLAMQLFGRSGKDMIPLLNLGSAGIREMAVEAERLGVVLSSDNVQAVKEFTAAQRDLGEAVSGFKLQLGFAVIPLLTTFSRLILEQQPVLLRWAENIIAATDRPLALLESGIKALIDWLERGARAIGGLLDRLPPGAADTLKTVALAIVGVGAALAFLLASGSGAISALAAILPFLLAMISPWALIAVGVVAAVAALVIFRDKIPAVGIAIDLLQTAGGKIVDVFNNLKHLFEAGFEGGHIFGRQFNIAEKAALKFGSTIRAVVDFIKGVFEGIPRFADLFAHGFESGELLEGGSKIERLAGELGKRFREVKDAVWPALKDAFIEIGQTLRNLGEAAGPPALSFLRSLVELVQRIGPDILNVAKNVATFVIELVQWARDSGLVATAFEGVKTILGVVGPLIGGLIIVVVKLVHWLSEHKNVLKGVAIALGIVLIAMNIIPAAIIGIILAIGWLANNWDSIKAKSIEVWTAITDWIDEKMGRIDEIIMSVIGGIVGFVTENWDLIKAIIMNRLELIVFIVQNRLAFIRDIFQLVSALFRGDWSEVWENLKQIVMGQIDLIVGIIKSQLEFIWLLFQLAWALIKDVTIRVWNEVKDFFTQDVKGFFTDTIPGWFQDAVSKITGAFNGVKDGVVTAWNAVKDFFTEDVKGFFTDTVPGWFETMGTNAADKIKVGINAILATYERGLQKIINGAFEAARIMDRSLPEVLTPWDVPETPTISLPRLHTGGRVMRSGLAVVQRGEQWTPAGAGGFAGATPTNVTINIGTLGPGVRREDVREIYDWFQDEARDRGHRRIG
jgi:phage-related protein